MEAFQNIEIIVQEGMHILKEKLPPGQRVVNRIISRHISFVPKFDPSNWSLTVDGEVEKTLSLK